MRKGICLKCGFCCWKYEVIPLNGDEVKSGEFKTRKNPDFPKEERVIFVKNIYISELGKKKKVCCYFVSIEKLCSIYNNRPIACRKFFCGRCK